MKSFVSKLRALIIGTFKTSLKEDTIVNTFELGVVTILQYSSVLYSTIKYS